MNKKAITAYFLKIDKVLKSNEKRSSLSPKEMAIYFSIPQIFPININKKYFESRYSYDEGGHICALYDSEAFFKHNTLIKPYPDYITGIFFKRRNNRWPYDEDGLGTLQEIFLPNNDHAIAETTYFIIDPILSILIWVGNQKTGGFNKFINYINDKNDIIYNNKNAFKVEADFITDAESMKNFELMASVRTFDLSIIGNLEFKSDKKYIDAKTKDIINFAKDISGTNISIHLSAGRSNKKGLNRNVIIKIYESLKQAFGKDGSKCTVAGMVDEHVRTIDLLEDHLIYKTEIEFKERYIQANDVLDRLIKAYENEYKPKIKKLMAYSSDNNINIANIKEETNKEIQRLYDENFDNRS